MISVRIVKQLVFALFFLSSTLAVGQEEPCAIVVPGQVLCDDFSDGNAQDGIPASWSPYNSTLTVQSGDLVVRGSNIPQAELPSSTFLGDVSVRATLRLEKGLAIGVAVRERNVPSYGNYWAAVGDRAYIGTESGYLAVSGPLDFDVSQEDVVIQFDAIGSELSLWAWPTDEAMPSSPLLAVTDTRIAAGEIFLHAFDASGSGPVTGIFRDVRIADRPIVIPEPNGWSLLVMGLLPWLFGRRTRRAT